MSEASVKAWADLEYVRTWPTGIVVALAVAALNLFLLRIASEHFFVSDLWAGAVPFLFWFWFGWSVRREATEQARLMTIGGYVLRRGAWVRPRVGADKRPRLREIEAEIKAAEGT